MSEYWKSTPKYYCKHCKTFVVDTPVSKKNHDASPKHQGALKRFLRDLHRTTEREATAATAAKREVARLNALVSGPSSSSSSTGLPAPTFKPAPARAATEDERKRHLKELESLGVALPDEARRELAMVGDWTAATAAAEAPGERATTTAGGREKEMGGGGEKERLRAELKRKHDAEEQERRWDAMDEDERAMRGFRIQTRTYPPGEGEGGGEVKKEEEKEEEEKGVVKKEEEEAAVKKEEEEEEKDEAPRIKKEETDMEGVVDVKAEVDANEAPAAEVVKKEKEEPENVSDGIVFKKRKVKNIRKRT